MKYRIKYRYGHYSVEEKILFLWRCGRYDTFATLEEAKLCLEKLKAMRADKERIVWIDQ